MTAGTPSEATVLIVDDDLMALTVQFGAASYTVAEGGMVTVTATISPAADRDVSVPLTASPAGFVPGDVTLLFASGETAVELEVNAPQDDDWRSATASEGTRACSRRSARSSHVARTTRTGRASGCNWIPAGG